jgi:hypothetical protein
MIMVLFTWRNYLGSCLFSSVVSFFYFDKTLLLCNKFDKPTPTGIVSCCTIFVKQSIFWGLHSILHDKSL